MANLAFYKNIFFFIFAGDILREPPHIHFSNRRTKDIYGKIWLETLEIAERGGFTQKELNVIKKLVSKYQKELIDRYKSFGKQTVKPINMILK